MQAENAGILIGWRGSVEDSGEEWPASFKHPSDTAERYNTYQHFFTRQPSSSHRRDNKAPITHSRAWSAAAAATSATMNQLLYYSLALYLALTPSAPLAHAAAAPAKETATPEPCTIRSPNTHAFFDLNPLRIEAPSSSKAKHPRTNSWNTTGWDLGYNFTMNFCGGVVEDLADMGGAEGVERGVWGNVSAYYKQGGKVFSIG